MTWIAWLADLLFIVYVWGIAEKKRYSLLFGVGGQFVGERA